MRENNKLFC